MAVCGGNSKESFFEMNTSNAVFQSQMILKQKPVEIGVFPWDLALSSAVTALTIIVK